MWGAPPQQSIIYGSYVHENDSVECAGSVLNGRGTPCLNACDFPHQPKPYEGGIDHAQLACLAHSQNDGRWIRRAVTGSLAVASLRTSRLASLAKKSACRLSMSMPCNVVSRSAATCEWSNVINDPLAHPAMSVP